MVVVVFVDSIAVAEFSIVKWVKIIVLIRKYRAVCAIF